MATNTSSTADRPSSGEGREVSSLRAFVASGWRLIGPSAMAPVAIAASAVGAVAIGRIVIADAVIRRLRAEEVEIRSLRVGELEVGGRRWLESADDR